MKKLVIIPTYNEAENIIPLFKEIAEQEIKGLDILVVDDGSPDGTADLVAEYQQNNPQVHILNRTKKEGLGRAYIAGFQWGLSQGYEAMIEMDADFSHRPKDLKKIATEIESTDVVIGSRYIDGGAVQNWTLFRKFISKGGSFYSTMVLWKPVKDWTGGFNAWTKEVLETIGLDKVQSDGYSFQIELKYRALKSGFKVKEVPIVFEDRREGQSKMDSKIFLEALYRVWKIRFI
ncbi:MAG: polyprenol monophosphomannose synthase [Bdellovibrionales bacterium]